MINIVNGNQGIMENVLIDYFNSKKDREGWFYTGYPIIPTPDGAFIFEAFLISRENGIVAFNFVNNQADIQSYKEEQDRIYNLIEAKLKIQKKLVIQRQLQIPIYVCSFIPNSLKNFPQDDDYPCFSTTEELDSLLLHRFLWKDIDQIEKYYEKTISEIQIVSTMNESKEKRVIEKKNSRGDKLRQLEEAISILDNDQSKSALETYDGVQRIRGLAGSGKTVVLAMKAAYLHMINPTWKIAVTFSTRSLKNHFKKLISTFYVRTEEKEPDWSMLKIIHAWGGPGFKENNGLYYSFCIANGVEYLNYQTAERNSSSQNAFSFACEKALADSINQERVPLYDIILIDEAQDLPVSFLKLCYEMVKEPKRLVYAYDELQNLRMQSLPSPEEIFGKDEKGNPRVVFHAPELGKPLQDMMLKRCYRNSKPVLVSAHALGFGIYRKPSKTEEIGLVQMFENNKLWQDIGYISELEMKEGKKVILKRTQETSPSMLENHSPTDDIIKFEVFKSKEEQDKKVAEEIYNNLKNDELKYNDIMVINPDPKTTRENTSNIRSLLLQKNIRSHIAGIDSTPDIFYKEEDNESIVFTGIYRAKGNEAAMVYIINADSCASGFELAKLRNRLFTAITRSKAWVRVYGVGKNMELLKEEFNQVKKHNFELEFIYPTEEQLKHINKVNRDMSEFEIKESKAAESSASQLISSLSNGAQLSEDMIKKLKEVLEKNEKED